MAAFCGSGGARAGRVRLDTAPGTPRGHSIPVGNVRSWPACTGYAGRGSFVRLCALCPAAAHSAQQLHAGAPALRVRVKDLLFVCPWPWRALEPCCVGRCLDRAIDVVEVNRKAYFDGLYAHIRHMHSVLQRGFTVPLCLLAPNAPACGFVSLPVCHIAVRGGVVIWWNTYLHLPIRVSGSLRTRVVASWTT